MSPPAKAGATETVQTHENIPLMVRSASGAAQVPFLSGLHPAVLRPDRWLERLDLDASGDSFGNGIQVVLIAREHRASEAMGNGNDMDVHHVARL